MATVLVGQLVQWQAREEIAPEIVLDGGTSLGHVRHVLELTFARPGTYRYHLRDSPTVGGTLVVGAP
jgi:plastocyanin